MACDGQISSAARALTSATGPGPTDRGSSCTSSSSHQTISRCRSVGNLTASFGIIVILPFHQTTSRCRSVGHLTVSFGSTVILPFHRTTRSGRSCRQSNQEAILAFSLVVGHPGGHFWDYSTVRYDLHRSILPANFLCTSHFALFAIH